MRSFLILLCLTFGLLTVVACNTAPKEENKAELIGDSESALQFFKSSVSGLDSQIANSAGYVIFPDVARWGLLFTGGTHGRGMVCRPDGTQIGWASISNASIGLQAGVEGFKLLMVLADDATMHKFQQNQLTGSVGGILVAGKEGGSMAAQFQDGVAIYEHANAGLMAGVKIGLDYIKFEPL